MAQRWKVGDKIKGKYDEYEVHRIAGGEGKTGMGVVYICYAIKQGLPVALKTFQEKFFASKEHQEMFRREALIWTELERYPYIVRAYWIEEVEGRLFIELEYVAPDKEGRNTLTHYLRELSLADSLKFAIQFCYGMEHAYSKGVNVHRDIKPDNIMVTQDKTVKITDFGLAKVFDKAEIEENAEFGMLNSEGEMGLSVFQSEVGRAAGTIPYMSPEQFEGKADRKSDIYSFGIVLYQMASGGKLPFVGRTWDEYYSLHKSGRIPPLNSPLFPIIERCMRRRNPQFEDFASLRTEIEKLLYQEVRERVEPPKVKELEAGELNNKGNALADLGRHNEAIRCFDKALELTSMVVEVWLNKGYALLKLDKQKEAIACYDKALEINPRYAEAWNNKGISLDNLGKHNEAILYYDKALEINPRYAEAWNNKGTALNDLGRPNEAITYYDKALELNPRYADAWYNKGLALAKLGRHNEAITYYDKALELNPRYADAWYNKGLALAKLGRHNEAITSYDKALELNTGFALAWGNKGTALAQIGKVNEAIYAEERFIEFAPAYLADDVEQVKGIIRQLKGMM